jgi:hypothetical protein
LVVTNGADLEKRIETVPALFAVVKRWLVFRVPSTAASASQLLFLGHNNISLKRFR